MGKVILDMSISLDGYIAGPNDNNEILYRWYDEAADDADRRNKGVAEELIDTLGAIVIGRRTYDITMASGGFEGNPYSATYVVATHTVPDNAADAPGVLFVTEGIASVIAHARTAAGEQDVAIGGGANVAQQALAAGLVDEIQLHVVPLLLGDGIRLFDTPGRTPLIKLVQTRVIDTPGVIHLHYDVVKENFT